MRLSWFRFYPEIGQKARGWFCGISDGTQMALFTAVGPVTPIRDSLDKPHPQENEKNADLREGRLLFFEMRFPGEGQGFTSTSSS